MINRLRSCTGFTLIEMVMVILIIGVLAGVASMTFMSTLDRAKFDATRSEMEGLARAIIGNPGLYADGARTDFGYVGDVGAMPADLDALAVNPGLGTWNGPYIKSDLDNNDFKRDSWNVDYVYNDTLLRSTGSGSDIDKIIAAATDDLLSNDVAGTFLDADRQTPGPDFNDSLMIRLTYPDGSGGLTNAAVTPNPNGNFAFSGVPIGNHTLQVVYIPDSDTTEYSVSVNPGRDVNLNIVFPADLW